MLRYSRTSVSLFSFTLCVLAPLVSSTISIVETGRTFESKPDRNVGQRLWKGYQYMGRTQILHENLSLCPNEHTDGYKYKITTPEDGLPVALIVTSDGCSIAEKAKVATTMMEPSGVVQYLIVKDHSRRLQGLDEPVDEVQHGELEIDDANEEELIFLENDDESFLFQPLNTTDKLSLSLETDDESYVGRFLRVEEQQPPVAILHVSSRVGRLLVNIVNGESDVIRRSGGTKILLNGEGPNGARMLLNWMLAIFFMCACGCCCMLMAVQTGMEDEQQQAPSRPARRRLTLQEVRERFPAFHFNPEEHHQANDSTQYCQLLDECTICLDEFHAGVRCRQLPCQHVFHSTCIARWLIERSAVCPLCKLDLFEDEEEDDGVEDDVNESETEESQPLFSRQWWSSFSNPRQQLATADTQGNVRPQPVGSSDPSQARTWWPFSVEVAEAPSEDAHSNTATGRPSRWRWNLFGRQRPGAGGDTLVTELTEPLISDETTESQPSELLPQNSLEEIMFSPTNASSDEPTSGADRAVPETEVV